jgi:ABC-type Fe3+ transport system permease subunit
MRLHNQKQRQWDKAVRRRPQQNRMSNQEKSRNPYAGKRRSGYRPAIVVFVILAAVVVGVVLKFNTREQRTATSAPEQTTQENPGLAIPR